MFNWRGMAKLPTRRRPIFSVADCVPDFGLAFSGDSDRLPLALALAAGWTTDLRQHIGRTVAGAIVLGGLFLVFVLIAAVVHVLARDFLVPIMALENLDFADGWHRLLTMIRPEKGRYAVYLLLKLVLSIAAAFCSASSRSSPDCWSSSLPLLPWWRPHRGMGWSVTTISLAIIVGTLLLLVFIYLVALVCVPATVFFPPMRCTFLPLAIRRLMRC